jgi:hypothetical protein
MAHPLPDQHSHLVTEPGHPSDSGEDSGPGDRAFELALLAEHISAWSDAQLDADTFLALFEVLARRSAHRAA